MMKNLTLSIILCLIIQLSFGQSQPFKFINNIHPENAISMDISISPQNDSESEYNLKLSHQHITYNSKGLIRKYVSFVKGDTVLAQYIEYNDKNKVDNISQKRFEYKDKELINTINEVLFYEYTTSALYPERAKVKTPGKLNTFIYFDYASNGKLMKERHVNLIEEPIKTISHKYDEMNNEINRTIETHLENNEVKKEEFKIEIDYYSEEAEIENRRIYSKGRSEWILMEQQSYSKKGKIKSGFFFPELGIKYDYAIQYEIAK